MRVSFDFLSEPIDVKIGCANVLCLENKALFRKIMQAFINDSTEEEKIVFSFDYKPFKARGNIYVISNYFNFDFSSSFIKKIYEEIVRFCVNDLELETAKIKSSVNEFMDIIMQSFDFDFTCKSEFELYDLFKIMNLKPDVLQNDYPSALLDFVFLIQKYIPQKCFVFFNLHSYLDADELQSFYKEMLSKDIRILLIESSSFEKSNLEKVRIIDKDFCEIVENS